MSFRLPTVDHPARELIDVAHVAEVLAPANVGRLLVTWQARRAALNAFEAAKASGSLVPSRICYIVLRADSDERWLISVGPKGGWRKEWNFGNGR